MELFKKEEAQFFWVEDKPLSDIDYRFMHDKKIMFRSYQSFLKNFINPNSTNSRLIVKHGTGSGKTKGSLAVAMEFIKFFKMQHIEAQILILGFQKDVFFNELIHSPDYGFVTAEEIARYDDLKYKIHNEVELKSMEQKFRKRITNPKYGGYFRFMGYKEFFNQMFFIPEEIWRKYGSASGGDFIHFNEDVMNENIKKDIIKVNHELINSMNNNLLICDEVHNVYNSRNVNSYGYAIKYLLDRPNMKLAALFLTATIANNLATEIIDILNLALPKQLNKKDFFDENGFLRDTALNKLAEISRGYVSFVINMNPRYFPQKIQKGESISIPEVLLKKRNPLNRSTFIPYLKFTRNYMSAYHQKFYDKYYTGSLNVNTLILNDIALPLPENYDLSAKNLMAIYTTASPDWLQSHEIMIAQNHDIGQYLSGGIFHVSNLKKYSVKYLNMINLIGEGKVFITHPNIKFGVFIIQEILRENGYVDYSSPPISSTKCSICGETLEQHNNSISHTFSPARFINIYGDMNQKSRSILINKFNAPNNATGEQYKILVGSSTVFEGVDFNCLRQIFIMSFPVDISTIIQIIGRGVRDRSHRFLPADKRTVEIRIFTSTDNNPSRLSYEEERYFIKMEDYLTIQQMEKVINANSVDAVINYNYTKTVDDPLIMLPFYPSESFGKWLPILDKKISVSSDANDKLVEYIDKSDFNIYYANDEVDLIIYIIKRLLLEVSPNFHVDDLWKYVQNPPFNININGSLFDFDNFLLAVDLLTNQLNYKINDAKTFVSSMFNDQKKIIAANGKVFLINLINDYIILLPYKEMVNYNTLGTNMNVANNSYINSIIDINTWSRFQPVERFFKYDVTDKLINYKISYEELKHRFYIENKDKDIMKVSYFNEFYNLQFHQRLITDTIMYIFYVMVNPEMSFSEMHEFYFKLLYLYYRLNLLLFAIDVKDTTYYRFYERFIDPNIDVKFYNKFDKELYDLNPLLLSSYTGVTGSFNISRMNEFLGNRPKSFMSQTTGLHFVNIKYQIQSIKKVNKVPINILPIGHYLTQRDTINVPEIFIEDSQSFIRLFLPRPTIIEEENNILVGYLEQDIYNINLVFKVREKIVEGERDRRMISKGMNCISKDKAYLSRKLIELDLSPKSTISDMCQEVKMELMHREIKAIKQWAHNKQKKIRWFYFHYEQKKN